MIGERIEARDRFPWWALFFLLVGLWLIGRALAYSSAETAFGAVLPLACGAAFWRMRHEPTYAATFQDDGIAIEDPPVFIPFARLRQVRIKHRTPDPSRCRKSSGAIQVEHEEGVLHIPPRLNVPSYQVYRFLAGRVPHADDVLDVLEIIDPDADSEFPPRRDVNPVLLDYLDGQEREFGPEKVWTYRAASNPAEGTGMRGHKAIAFGLLLAGLVWMVLGYSGFGDPIWGGTGIACVCLSGPVFLAAYVGDRQANRDFKNWKNASLVLGPRGMALVQDTLQGVLLWSEVEEVHFREFRPPFSSPKTVGWKSILLNMKGAGVVIVDIYDRPILLIHARIVALSGKSATGGVPIDVGAVALLKKSPSS